MPVDEGEYLGARQNSKLLLDIGMQSETGLAGAFLVLQHGIEVHAIEIAQAYFMPNLLDSGAISVRDRTVEAVPLGVTEDHGVLWNLGHQALPFCRPQ